jgi:pre-rRNA-processing protein IPI1
LTPHLSLLLLQTASSLSHIFPEIRLDACKLVNLFLEHVPSHVVGTWPRGSNTILEGLRLSLGVGDGAGVGGGTGKIGMGGRAIVMKALRGFLGFALKKEVVADGYWSSVKHGKGKGKEREIQVDGVVDGWRDDGYLVGSDQWALDTASSGWELGRLDGSSGMEEQHTETDSLSVIITFPR